jgi:hypothetical protein
MSGSPSSPARPSPTLLRRSTRPRPVVSLCSRPAGATTTPTVHQHVHTGMGREAADPFAALLDG